ncbi:MAG: DNA translocase FtsK [Nitrospirae bacterium]|nr:DNA translocase FtsK [Nitrospirota bacterium]
MENTKRIKNDTWSQRKGEIIGILWIVLSLLLFASLVSYHPGDPSLNAASSNPEVKNVVGRVGAVLSDMLFMLLGGGAYLLPVLTAVIGWGKIKNTGGMNLSRWIGFSGLLASIPLYFQLYFGKLSLSFNEPFPAGGILGTLLSKLLVTYSGPMGSAVVTLTTILLSVVLFTGVSPVQWGKQAVQAISKGASTIGNRKRKAETLHSDAEEGSPGPEALLQGRTGTVSPEASKRTAGKPKISDLSSAPRVPPIQEEFDFLENLNRGNFRLPPLSLLEDPPKGVRRANRDELLMSSQILEKKLRDFGVEGAVVQVHPGPVITMYEFEPAPGVKLNQIVNRSDDLALATKSGSVRIVAPIPNKSTVGIEVPNRIREEVRLKEILASEPFTSSRSPLTLALGRDIFGTPITADLMRMPHLLVAGATGSGKSVALNAMISSLLFRTTPAEVRMLLIDPKMIELSAYDGIPHLLRPVITRPKEAAWALHKVISEMQRRYQLLSERGHRNVESYHRAFADEQKKKTAEELPERLPYVVVIIDELADLMMVAGREVEDAIARLAQMARAAGIHMIVATQRPSVDVITGVIKANFPTRISFQVSSKTDSRTILDANGAEELLGKGDMLFLPPGSGRLNRIHGAYISDEEIREVVSFIREQSAPAYDPSFEAPSEEAIAAPDDAEEDACYQQAKDLVLSTGQASISMIQRRLRIGFNRAARMIERMEEEGLVSTSHSGKREVYKKKALDL